MLLVAMKHGRHTFDQILISLHAHVQTVVINADPSAVSFWKSLSFCVCSHIQVFVYGCLVGREERDCEKSVCVSRLQVWKKFTNRIEMLFFEDA